LREGFEDQPLFAGIYADTRVAHLKVQVNPILRTGMWFHGHFQANLALLGELDAVAEQVDNDLLQARRICHDFLRHLGANIAGQFQPLLLGPEGQQSDALDQVAAQVETDGIQIEPARFNLGKVQNIVDHGE